MKELNPLITDFLNTDCSMSERMHSVVELFEDHFGKDHIDVTTEPYKRKDLDYTTTRGLGNAARLLSEHRLRHTIVIKIDRAVVTNELGNSTTIYNLFVQLKFTQIGTLQYDISYKRNLFTKNQLYSRYIHSHCPSLNTSDTSVWNGVCTGSGPINGTMSRLSIKSTWNIETLMGFIAELEQIIKIESLAGGPYIRISDIKEPYTVLKQVSSLYISTNTSLVKSYIRSNRLKLSFQNGQFFLGCTFLEWLTDFSEYCRVWEATNHKLLRIPRESVSIINDQICVKRESGNTRDFLSLIGKPVITFKGTDYKIALVEGEDKEVTQDLISPNYGATILRRILNTLNQWYGKPTEKPDGTKISYPDVIYQ